MRPCAVLEMALLGWEARRGAVVVPRPTRPMRSLDWCRAWGYGAAPPGGHDVLELASHPLLVGEEQVDPALQRRCPAAACRA